MQDMCLVGMSYLVEVQADGISQSTFWLDLNLDSDGQKLGGFTAELAPSL